MQVSTRLRTPLLLTTLLLVICLLSACHKRTAEEQVPSITLGTNQFVGTWKLNLNQSSRTGTRDEVIAIKPEATDFRFDIKWESSNGTELNYWFVTKMDGGTTKLTQTDGKPMGDEWRITRSNSSSFLVQSGGPFARTDRYEVSSDGQTLTKQRLPNDKGLVVGNSPEEGKTPKQNEIMVFERVR